MTTSRIEAIRARLLAATPGPWVLEQESLGFGRPVTVRIGGVCANFLHDDPERASVQVRDYTFIAHAPEDVRWLLAEVGRLREKNAELNRRCQAAEKAALENVEACRRAGCSLGRSLANFAASSATRERDKLRAEVEAGALMARAAAVMARRRWGVEWSSDHGGKYPPAWYCLGPNGYKWNPVGGPGYFYSADPFTCVIEADAWYAANVEGEGAHGRGV